MSTPNLRPEDLFSIIGGLTGGNRAEGNQFDLGGLLGGLLGADPFGAPAQPATATAEKKTPSAGRVAADVFTAAGSVGDFVKANLPKLGGSGALEKEELVELLIDMLSEHDNLGPEFALKRDSLYRATATKWAERIIKKEKSEAAAAPSASSEAPVKVSVNPREVISVPITDIAPDDFLAEATQVTAASDEVRAPLKTDAVSGSTELPPVTEESIEIIAELIHATSHPDHPLWSECKEANVSCRYETKGAALAALQGKRKA